MVGAAAGKRAAHPRASDNWSPAGSGFAPQTHQRLEGAIRMFRRRHQDVMDPAAPPMTAAPATAGNRYRMVERMVSFGDDFWIQNDLGQRVFKVDGKALRIRDTLIF